MVQSDRNKKHKATYPQAWKHLEFPKSINIKTNADNIVCNHNCCNLSFQSFIIENKLAGEKELIKHKSEHEEIIF